LLAVVVGEDILEVAVVLVVIELQQDLLSVLQQTTL
jgi:hypothetical protein